MHLNRKIIGHNAAAHVIAVLKLERFQGREIECPQTIENTCPSSIVRISRPVYHGTYMGDRRYCNSRSVHQFYR